MVIRPALYAPGAPAASFTPTPEAMQELAIGYHIRIRPTSKLQDSPAMRMHKTPAELQSKG